VRNLKYFSLFIFLALASEVTFIKTHDVESRFVTGPENILVCRRVHALFSPEILQDGAVKGGTLTQREA